MMKKLTFLLLFLFVFLAFPLTAYCTEAEETIGNIEESFYSGLDSEVYELLEEFGLDSFDAGSIFTDGGENIRLYFADTLKQKLQQAAGWFFLGAGIVMILGIISSAFDFAVSGDAFSLFSSAVICLITVSKISSFLNCVVSCMSLNGKLMLSFIPVFALLVSLSGNPASALTYNSLLLFFCESMSFFLDNLFVSVIGVYFCLSIGFSFNPTINLNRFTNGANRIFSLVLGSCGTLFTSVLSLKNILAAATDSLSVKGVRFLLGSLVPVIGPSLSEAYSSVLGSINLMKSSFAVLGIFALVIINIPALTEGVIYFFLMTVLSCFAEITGLYRVSECFRSLASCVKLMLLVCLFQMFILIISIGVMMTLRGGAGG